MGESQPFFFQVDIKILTGFYSNSGQALHSPHLCRILVIVGSIMAELFLRDEVQVKFWLCLFGPISQRQPLENDCSLATIYNFIQL
jgi:hypothetical protein